MPILLALVGATGIGKTQLALSLAERYGAEIISVDSRQIYRGFSIGTAQPTPREQARVCHHLVDFLDPSQVYSAGGFCSGVKDLLRQNSRENYILVGGTGLYLQALLLGLPQIPPIDAHFRQSLEDDASQHGNARIYEMACEADPEAMRNVDSNNVQRMVRILEVWRGTGRKLSEWQKHRVGGIGKLPVFWLNRSRENLYTRIDARVDQMMADGWLDEVRSLSKKVPIEAPAWQSLGYRELLNARNEDEVKLVLEQVKRKTRNYAKRQLTWFRWQIETVEINLDTEADKAFDKIKSNLRSFSKENDCG